ncbi:U1 small nuclear ribonucleoprotein A [Striga asiatica]|uniref:U1 small nuclear ribonucleoprotein A n=1 Tax=Striga asiatica TaxID=4170 RepID=A0A5A7RLT1_STRAF|nr:U1 small nuclear ribonucleoprotein A [Striga asiatica]
MLRGTARRRQSENSTPPAKKKRRRDQREGVGYGGGVGPHPGGYIAVAASRSANLRTAGMAEVDEFQSPEMETLNNVLQGRRESSERAKADKYPPATATVMPGGGSGGGKGKFK